MIEKPDQVDFLIGEPKEFSPKCYQPLAMRMRPQDLEDVLGQDHILGESSILPRLIKSNQFNSLLFYGPPGSGKTTIANVIANETNNHFVKINAITSNVAEVRDILKIARYRKEQQTLLFIDEIHRFNKAQQDLLLPDIEEGNIKFIGATTHNPSFYIIPPLLSRSHLFRLEPVSEEFIVCVLEKAMKDSERGLASARCLISEKVLRGVASLSNGDLRQSLNTLETLVLSQSVGTEIEERHLESFAKERNIRYDRNEDEHYDTISAFIKSIRGCDPDAALYWLAKMLEGKEDPRFIARRLVILASEDVGLGDSRALPLAVATFQACDLVGLPECELNLAHATVFIAMSPKSNSTYQGLLAAKESIRKTVQPIPAWLRSSKNPAAKSLGYGKDYKYSHEFVEAISGQEYMVNPIQFYKPKQSGAETHIAERLATWKTIKSKLSK